MDIMKFKPLPLEERLELLKHPQNYFHKLIKLCPNEKAALFFIYSNMYGNRIPLTEVRQVIKHGEFHKFSDGGEAILFSMNKENAAQSDDKAND